MLIDYKLIERDTNIFIARRDFQLDPLSDLLTRNSGTRVIIYYCCTSRAEFAENCCQKKVKVDSMHNS